MSITLCWQTRKEADAYNRLMKPPKTANTILKFESARVGIFVDVGKILLCTDTLAIRAEHLVTSVAEERRCPQQWEWKWK